MFYILSEQKGYNEESWGLAVHWPVDSRAVNTED
jgi:hypothetical protein